MKLSLEPSPDAYPGQTNWDYDRAEIIADGVVRCHRYVPEARTSRAVRSPGHRCLPAAGLERCHCLRLVCVRPPEREPMASRNRRHSLFSRRALSCLAGATLSQCDLARFCADRRKLPLFGGPRLLAVGISGLCRAARAWTQRDARPDEPTFHLS